VKTLKKGVVEITDGPHGVGTSIFVILLLIVVAVAYHLVEKDSRTVPLSACPLNTHSVTSPDTDSLSLAPKTLRAKP